MPSAAFQNILNAYQAESEQLFRLSPLDEWLDKVKKKLRRQHGISLTDSLQEHLALTTAFEAGESVAAVVRRLTEQQPSVHL